ncbi:MAG: pyridoxamine 5'-phosphate oxidase family protein [Clostridiales bacterium]|nr:pyridoxamine 5'-phosphate oxidase family protein [Clostridiales bacterium]
MRRKEKSMESMKEIELIIQSEKVLRLGLCAENQPYIVPVNYGYLNKQFFIHCAKEGRKLDMIAKNPNVCIEIERANELVTGDVACQYTMKFESIIGFGQATILTELEDVKMGLEILMAQFSDLKFTFNEKAMSRVAIIKIDIDEITGKKA